MAGDDILWKNVEALKEESPKAPKDARKRPKTGHIRAARTKKVSPTLVSADDANNALAVAGERAADKGGSTPPSNSSTAATSVQAYGRTPVRSDSLLNQVPGRPAQRRPERYAFQFWADQITRLKKLRHVLNMAQDPETREEIALSDLVREAVDEYLDRQIRPDDPNARAYA